MILGIDHGFGEIKTRNTRFKTGLSSFVSEPAIQAGDTLFIDGMYHMLSGTRQAVRYDKTTDENYWILTLMAIAKELIAKGCERRDLSVTIAAGLPLGSFSSQKDQFRAYLARTGTRHHFLYNREEFAIEIETVRLFPQGYSAVLDEITFLKNEPVVHIVDIGSWTTDIVTLKNGIPDGDTITSWENGVIKCFEYIIERIKAQFGITYHPEQIEAVLWNNHVTIPDHVRIAIKDAARNWSENFVRQLAEKRIDIPATVVRFLGGGAHILSEFYRAEHQEEVATAKFIEDVAANAIGYETAAAVQQATEAAQG